MDMLLTACEQFLGKPDSEIRSIARETLEGHQRAMMGNMTVEVCIVGCIYVVYRCMCYMFMSVLYVLYDYILYGLYVYTVSVFVYFICVICLSLCVFYY